MLLPAATSRKIISTIRAVFLRTSAQTRVFALITIFALPHAPLLAQEPTTDDDVVRVKTDLLVFPIRVRIKSGPSDSVLTERDLILKDEDHVTAGLYLYRGADRVALVFALDQSGSLREIISQQREAALALFGRFGDRSQVAVLRFSEKPLLVAPFGKDTRVAREAFNFPVEANRHTAIFDAADTAVRAFEQLPRVRSERRIVVLISDGLDNASTIKAAAIIRAALQKQISFYVIHLPLFEPRDGRLAVRSPSKGFYELAEKTGGKYFLARDPRTALAPQTSIDLTPIFNAIEEDLSSQYLLGFYAGEGSRDSRKHRFAVSLPAGFEYQVADLGYSRTHQFLVNTPGGHQTVAK